MGEIMPEFSKEGAFCQYSLKGACHRHPWRQICQLRDKPYHIQAQFFLTFVLKEVVGISDCQRRTFSPVDQSFDLPCEEFGVGLHTEVQSYELLRLLEDRYSKAIHPVVVSIYKTTKLDLDLPFLFIILLILMMESQQLVSVHPEGVLTFYRNEYQSAATITIIRLANCKQIIRYSLKTTHKDAYLVSKAKGQLKEGQTVKYIDILINQEYPLEQCLLDRFKMVVVVQGKSPIQKKFKVAINYKKDTSRYKEKDLNVVQTTSRTTGSQSTSAPTAILGRPLALPAAGPKGSKIATFINSQEETDKINLQEELDQIVKVIEERRLRLQYLNQQIIKKKSRKKFGRYLMLLAILISFLLGLAFKQLAQVGKREYQNYYGL